MHSLSLAASFTLLGLVTQVASLTILPPLEPYPPRPVYCCYGDKTYKPGELALSFQRSCLQLVCGENGMMERRYLGEPGDKGCCEFDGVLYPDGGLFVPPYQCITMTCKDSCWTPVMPIDKCCAICRVYNDPHFNTFDDYNYDFHGTCNYSIAQVGNSYYPEAGVFSDFNKCFGKASCLAHTTFRNDPHTIITLNTADVHEVLVNGHPFRLEETGKVYALKSADGCTPVLAWHSPWKVVDGQCIVLFGTSKFMIQHCRHRMTVWAHPTYLEDMYGLCGYFNGPVADDFTARNSTVYPLTKFPLGFPNSWKTKEQSSPRCKGPCRDCHKDSTEDPCTASADDRAYYKKKCQYIINPVLAKYPNLAFHIDACIADLCLVNAHKDDDISVTDWLKNVDEIVKMGTEIQLRSEEFFKVGDDGQPGAPTTTPPP